MLKGAVGALIAAYIALGQLKVKFYDEKYEVELLEQYDFIVVGAGTSGSVVASRLSDNPNTTVLLLEAGPSGRGDSRIDVPYFQSKLPGSEYDWGFTTVPMGEIDNRAIQCPSGKVGGGTSTMNAMVYMRGTKRDYDLWEELGADGWRYNDIVPFFLKAENATSPGMHADVGTHGNVKLSTGYSHEPFYNFIVDSFKEIGYRAVDYFAEHGMSEGVSKVTASAYNGVRQTSMQAYIYPKLDAGIKNLHVSFHSMVHKILFDDERGQKRARGVRFKRRGKMINIGAKKEVIISGGAINSPKLLMLSGVGPWEHLAEIGVKPEVNLPGVGQNLQNHIGTAVSYYGDKLPRNISLSNKEVLKTFPNYMLGKYSPLDAVVPISPIAHTVSNKGDASQNRGGLIYFFPLQTPIASLSKNVFKKQIRHAKKYQNGILNHFTVFPSTATVKSTGSIKLISNRISDSPAIDMGYFTNPDDIRGLIKVMRVMEKIEMTEIFQNYGIKVAMQPFCNQSEVNSPPRSDEYYRCLFKNSLMPVFHLSSTNKMGRADDTMAVVDPRLRVYGVNGLRVADASVMPKLVSANTQATCYMIGEKAAHMIKQDWDL